MSPHPRGSPSGQASTARTWSQRPTSGPPAPGGWIEPLVPAPGSAIIPSPVTIAPFLLCHRGELSLPQLAGPRLSSGHAFSPPWPGSLGCVLPPLGLLLLLPSDPGQHNCSGLDAGALRKRAASLRSGGPCCPRRHNSGPSDPSCPTGCQTGHPQASVLGLLDTPR